jgi:hypothetical protein
MGGLFSSKVPAPPPVPARPVTAVTKTPELELEDTELATDKMSRKRRGKKGLRTDITKDVSTQVGSTGAGLQIPTANSSMNTGQ